MKECPNCKAVRENYHRYCECGYDLKLNTLDDIKANNSRLVLIFLIIIFNNLFLSVLGVHLTPIVLIGLFGFFNDPTVWSIVIALLVLVIFLAVLVTSNYLIIRKFPGKSKIYLALTCLATLLLGFILLLNANFN